MRRSPTRGYRPREFSSGADTETEAQIFEHFRSLNDRIAILISHWFSTVQHADQIVDEIVRTAMPSSLAAGAYAQQSA